MSAALAPVRFGVLGCADIALRKMLPAMTQEPSVHLVAVASRDGDTAQRVARQFDCDPEHGYRALLDRPDIDAVYLPLPAMLHDEWVDIALRAGKHVLVEKPLTSDGHRARKLRTVARQRGRQLMESFMFLHHSQHARVAELVRDGAIGELRSFASAFTIPPRPAEDIRYQPDVGGGALVDIGVYPLRAAQYFLGPDLELTGAVLRVDRERGGVLSGSVLLHSPAGVGAQLSFGMEQSYRCEYQLYGSTGALSLDRAFTTPDDHRPVVRVARQGEARDEVLAADAHFRNTLQRFTAAVHGSADLDRDLAASVRLMDLLGQISDSARRVRV